MFIPRSSGPRAPPGDPAHPVPAHLRRTADTQSVVLVWQQHHLRFPRLLFVLADTGKQAARQRIRELFQSGP